MRLGKGDLHRVDHRPPQSLLQGQAIIAQTGAPQDDAVGPVVRQTTRDLQ